MKNEMSCKISLVLLAVLLTALLAPCASAISYINEPSKEIYNLGDKLDISGYILETKDTWGLMKIDLFCEENTPLLARTVSIKANEKLEFSEELPIPYYITGICKAVMKLNAGENTIEQIETKSFTITKDLLGSFEASESMVQLGDSVIIKGKITRQDGAKVNGVATLYFKKDGENVHIDSINIEEGKFEYEFDSIAKPAGVYDLVVFASDMFGNEKLLTDIPQISLVNEIYVFAKPNKESVLPDSVVTIFGEAKTILQKKVEKADVVIVLDEVQYKTNAKNGEFSERIKLKENIKSGKHDVHVIVEDELGNVGETDTSFLVQAVPAKLEAEIIGGPFKPKESIHVVPKLYDQAGDLIIESINLVLHDSKGNEAGSGSVETGKEIVFELPEFAEPGNWWFTAKASGLETKVMSLVGEITGIKFSVDNETLIAVNIGNTKYKGVADIFIEGDGESSEIHKKISLNPGAEVRINLAREVNTGVYTIKVNEDVFSDVKITSQKSIFSYDYIYYIAVIVLAGLLIWLFLFKRKPKIKKKSANNKAKSGKNIAVNEENIKKAETPEDAKKRYNEDFKQMVLKNIEERDNKVKKGMNFDFLKKKKEKSPEVVRLGDREFYRKKTEKEQISNVLWSKRQETIWSKPKKISREQRKEFVKQAKKDSGGGGLFDMFS